MASLRGSPVASGETPSMTGSLSGVVTKSLSVDTTGPD